MSNQTWTGSSGNLTGNWNNAADWHTAVPATTDTADITSAGTGAYTVTLNVTTTINALFIKSANATLDIAGNTLTVTGNSATAIQISSAGGQITMEGGTLAGTGTKSGITLSGGSLIGVGTVSLLVAGAGIYQAKGGTLDLSKAVQGSAKGLEIAAGSGNVLELGSTVASGAAVTFLGGNGVLDFNEASNSGFASNLPVKLTVGSDLVAADNDVIEFGSVTVSSASFNSSNDVLTVTTSGGTFNLKISAESGSLTGAIAHHSGNEVFLSTACYLAGTRILTRDGEVAVEDLVTGDRVMTLSGEAKRIKWIGTRAYDPRFVDGNPEILPICIKRGALGGGLPWRDLFVSPEHSLFIDGMLVPAKGLVNGVSIVQEWRGRTIAYYHVELAEHDVIYAEGAPAESYIDCGNRGMFQNATEFDALYPEDASRPWAYCAPVVDSGPELEGVCRRIAEHSAALAEDTLWRGSGASAALASSASTTPPAIIRLAA
jgi:formylmethanofuran dehydrogenase subunit C